MILDCWASTLGLLHINFQKIFEIWDWFNLLDLLTWLLISIKLLKSDLGIHLLIQINQNFDIRVLLSLVHIKLHFKKPDEGLIITTIRQLLHFKNPDTEFCSHKIRFSTSPKCNFLAMKVAQELAKNRIQVRPPFPRYILQS